jgi:mannose/fructose/sorbose-specific phosphotransferase system IIA component
MNVQGLSDQPKQGVSGPINILIASHGDLGEALVNAARMIVGPTEGLFAAAIQPGETPETFQRRLDDLLTILEGEKLLILVDVLGGTPYNAVGRLAVNEQIACISGANLPMVLEALLEREEGSLDEVAAAATRAGQEAIRNVGSLLRR